MDIPVRQQQEQRTGSKGIILIFLRRYHHLLSDNRHSMHHAIYAEGKHLRLLLHQLLQSQNAGNFSTSIRSGLL